MIQVERRLTFVLPGSIDFISGGTIYDKRLIDGLHNAGWHVDLIELAADFPVCRQASIEDARLKLCNCRGLVIIDGLACGVLGTVLRDMHEAWIVDLVHHPLCLETGLDAETAGDLAAKEAEALNLVDHVIVTSQTSKCELVARFGFDAGRINVAEPGQDRAAIAQGGEIFTIVKIGALIPRKNHPLLLRALTDLLDLEWQLCLIGSLSRDVNYSNRIRQMISALNLYDRVEIFSEIGHQEVTPIIAQSHAMVSASLYEGYGMALCEGLAAGLPIVAVRGGATDQTVPAQAGILVDPVDPKSLAQALRALMTDTKLYRELKEGALIARNSLPRWEETVRKVDAVLTGLLERG